MDLVVPDQVQRLLPTLGHQRVVALRRHDLTQGLSGARVVVSDQDRVGSTESHDIGSQTAEESLGWSVGLIGMHAPRRCPLPITPPFQSGSATQCKTQTYD